MRRRVIPPPVHIAPALAAWCLLAATARPIDIPFSAQVIDAGNSGDCKAVADIDGDGRDDPILGGSSLVWYDAGSGFAKRTVRATPVYGQFTTDMQAADLDDDGDPDIVVGDENGPDNILWFENPRRNPPPGTSADPESPANWTFHIVGSHGSWPHDVEVGDIDGDGRPDIVTSGNGHTHVWKQVTPAAWTKKTLSSLAGSGVFLGDIDRDGDLDLATPGRWLRAPADIIAGSWIAFPLNGTSGKDEVLLADLNHDGRLDLATCDAHSGQEFAWFEAPADPTQPVWIKRQIDPAFGAHHPEAVDFNRDGWLDILMGLELTSVSLFINNRDGTFTRQQLDSTAGHNARAGDFDGDGDADVFGCDWIGHPPAKVYINGGHYILPLTEWTYLTVTSNHEQSFGLAFGDLNSDARPDILSGHSWYQNPGGNLTGAWPQRTLPAGMHALLVARVDADGLTDVIASRDEGALALYWLEASDAAATSWTTARIGELPAASHALGTQGYRLADLIPGGRPEIIVTAGDGAHYFSIPAANPEAGSWPSIRMTASTSDEGVDVGDVDRDGWPDLIGTTGAARQVQWFRNPGSAGGSNWSAHLIGAFPEADFPDRCATADLNGDGRLDVVVTEENGGTGALTFWWEQPAVATTPNWTRHLIATLGSTNSMSLRDLDRDGDADVILGEHRGPDLRHLIFANDGTGHFTQLLVGSGHESHLGSQAVDLDGDADDDIVSIAYDQSQNIHLFRNDASGLETAGTVTMVPDGGSFTGAVIVTLTSSAPEAIIRFTLDGTEPSDESTAYPGPITLSSTATLRARAFIDSLPPGPTRSAHFTILPDTTAPIITSVIASGLPNQIRIIFDEPVEEPTAEDPANWQISGLAVHSATLSGDGRSLVLATAPMTDGTTYPLTVRNLRDRAVPPNIIPADIVTSFVFTALPAEGLIHHWTFDEGAGMTAHDSVAGADGTLGGATWSPEGRRFAALDFNGAGRVSLGALDFNGSAATIALWFRHRSSQPSVDPRLISKATGTAEQSHHWMLSLTNVGGDDRLRFRLKAGGSTTTLIASSGAVPLDEWLHATAVYDGSAMELFLDGELVGTAVKSGSIDTAPLVQAAIGNQPEGAGATGFDGLIDEVRLYNRALTTAEIGALVNGPAPPGFADWIAGFELTAEEAEASADPDFDGLVNLAEYAFGENPTAGNPSPLSAEIVSLPGGESHLAVRFPLVKSATDVTCQVEVSEDLVTWTAAASFVPKNSGAIYVASPHSQPVSRLDQGTTLVITERDSLPPTSDRRFLRVAATLAR